jgi:hypothetical protein
MEPLWEYQYEVWDGPMRGMRKAAFYLTDEEAERWPRLKDKRTRRLDETKRDRNLNAPIPIGMPYRR